MSKVVRYVVVRAAPDLPEGFLPAHLDGCWFDPDDLRVSGDVADDGQNWDRLALAGGAVAVVTDRFESRDDGTLAQVYEVRP